MQSLTLPVLFGFGFATIFLGSFYFLPPDPESVISWLRVIPFSIGSIITGIIAINIAQGKEKSG